MLERMYLRWAEAQGHRTRVLDRQQGRFPFGAVGLWDLCAVPKQQRLRASCRVVFWPPGPCLLPLQRAMPISHTIFVPPMVSAAQARRRASRVVKSRWMGHTPTATCGERRARTAWCGRAPSTQRRRGRPALRRWRSCRCWVRGGRSMLWVVLRLGCRAQFMPMLGGEQGQLGGNQQMQRPAKASRLRLVWPTCPA